MAEDILRFAVLGLGAGAVYALTALGLVLIYRGSGVLNFAQGAIGMAGAFVFYEARESGTETWMCWALALGFGALVGAGMQLLLMRPLRHAPGLSRLIATLGVFTVLYAWGQQKYGDIPMIVTRGKLLPSVDVFELFGDVSIGEDRAYLLAIGVALTVVLSLVYRTTKFGLATSAVAENRRATAAQGISPDLIATCNWMLGCMLAVLAAVLIVNIAPLSVTGLTLLIVPALAAALVGSFRSFSLTLLGGLVIGVLESEVLWLQNYLTERRGEVFVLNGWAQTVPFLVIIVVLVVRGRALPLRGDARERPPEVGAGRIRRIPLAVAAVTGVVCIATVMSTSMVDAVTASAAVGVVALSLVVVTGYTGQLSLAQFALAGMGAWIAARLIADHGFGWEVAAIVGILGAIPVGVLVGLPSLRTRGVNLAVATLGLALVLQAQILANGDRTGGITGIEIGTPTFLGFDLDPVRHPERYALMAFLCLVVLGVAVANLRRGRAGRRLVAVRSNERAAAALGISVYGAKLYAFGLSAAIAAVGGVLIVYRNPTAVFFPTFSIFQSIFVVVYAVIGGIGFVVGAFLGGAISPGGVVNRVFGDALGSEQTVRLILGVGLLLVLFVAPDGLAGLHPSRWPVVRRLWRRPIAVPVVPQTPTRPEVERVEPKTLDVRGLTVRFGGVVAVDDVSLSLTPGEIHGLIGPNGAGKTTVIDAITGFVAAATGTVTIDGMPAPTGARRRARAGIGRSFQGLELFESLSVRENLRAACDSRDARAYLTDLVWPGAATLDAVALAAVDEFGLEGDLDRRPEELPYGRRRLVAIARAIAASPSILLLDEPAAGLDDHERAELGELLRRLAVEWGFAVLLVEHDVALVMDVCDEVTVLESGSVIATGGPDTVRHDPAVVAAYLGEPEPPAPPVPDADVEPAPIARSPVVTVRAGATADPEAPVLIEARGLSAGYGDLPAVRELDLAVREGEVVALLGPNGSGKTTTLLALAGELPPLAGEVAWWGGGASRRRPLQRRVREGLAFVPEERSVVSSITTRGNLRLGRGGTDAAVAIFPELESLLTRRAGLLSGGEQQILTLARALATRPRLLLADELSLGLAPMVVQRLLDAVRAAADDGLGVVLVEQHAVEALRIADRVVVLRHGSVALSGTADELRAHLDDLEAAYLAGITSGGDDGHG